jgi:hypothetical protein
VVPRPRHPEAATPEQQRELAFLRRYPLGFVTQGRRVTCHLSSGTGVPNPTAYTAVQKSIEVVFPEGVPFLAHPDGTSALCLWPFVMQREPELGGPHVLYLFDAVEASGAFLNRVQMTAIDRPDTWTLRIGPDGVSDYRWLLEQLGQLPIRLAVPAELRLAERLVAPAPAAAESLPSRDNENPFGVAATGSNFVVRFGVVRDAMRVPEEHNRVRVYGPPQGGKRPAVTELMRRAVARWNAHTIFLDIQQTIRGSDIVSRFAEVFGLQAERVTRTAVEWSARRVLTVVVFYGAHRLHDPAYADELAGLLADLFRHGRGGTCGWCSRHTSTQPTRTGVWAPGRLPAYSPSTNP